MAEKRIVDFDTLESAQDEDLLLIASENETYNIKYKTVKAGAEAAATAAQEAAETAAANASAAARSAGSAAETARSADDKAENAMTKANAAMPKAGGTFTGDVGFKGQIAFIPTAEGKSVPYLEGRTDADGVPQLNVMGTEGDEPVRIYGVSEPKQGADAAPKSYVDRAAKQLGFASGTVGKVPMVKELNEDGSIKAWELGEGGKGKDGSPGIVISSTQPTGPNHPVWLDPDGDASPIPWVPQPATAAVGQIVKVKAVDSEGHITETEAVAMPSGGGGGGAETWEEVSTIPLTAGTAVYNLGSLTTYRKLRIVGSTKLVTTVSGNNWLSINDPNNHTGAALARILIPSNGWLTYINRWIDVARDNLWAEWIGIYANNTAVPQQPTMLRHRVTWPEGETQLVLSLTAETAAAIADGAEITIYGVRA